MSSSTYAPWSVEKKPFGPLKIMTFNILRVRGHAKRVAYLNESWMARKRQVKKLVATEHPDVVCFQEFRDTALDTMDDFFDFTPRYEHRVFAPNPDPIALRVAIAWNPQNVFPIRTENRWLGSKSGDGTMPDGGADPDGKGKIIAGIQFVRVKDGSFVEGAEPFWVFCTHFSMERSTKDAQAADANRIVRELAGDQPAVLCGDLNFFDDLGGVEQRATLVGDYFNDAFADPSTVRISHDNHPDDVGVEFMDTKQYNIAGTFFGMESDTVKGALNVGTTPSRLDHILVTKGINVSQPTMVCKTMLPYPSKLFSARNYPSDHFPLTLLVDI